jgi:hypothetical protein
VKSNRQLLSNAVASEINFAFLFVSVARSAYTTGDIARGNEARETGQAAYLRAKQLLGQADEKTRKSLSGDLEALQTALERLSGRAARS